MMNDTADSYHPKTKPRIPRIMLWTDKKSMDEFLDNPLDKELYKLFEQLNKWPITFKMDEVVAFNEVHYLITRIVYNRLYDRFADPEYYIRDAYANMGMADATEAVLAMAYVAMSITNIITQHTEREFIGWLEDIIEKSWFHDSAISFINDVKKEKKSYSDSFAPCPCPYSVLVYQYIDWKEVTADFELEAIQNILELLKSYTDEEKVNVCNMMSDALSRYAIITYRDQEYPEKINEFYRDIDFQLALLKKDHQSIIDMAREPFSTISVLELKLKQMEKRYNQLESEKIRLEAELNKKEKNISDKVRMFTLEEIVNYAANNLDLTGASPVQNMLYNLLAENGTNDERKKVNEINSLIIKRMTPQINGVSMEAFYKITGNENVNLGGLNHGGEEN